MRSKCELWIPAVLVVAFSQPLLAGTVVQPATLAHSNTGSLYQGTGAQNLVESDFITADFQPFDPALGTLESFTFRFEAEVQLSGTAGETGGGVWELKLTGEASTGYEFRSSTTWWSQTPRRKKLLSLAIQ